MHPNSINSGMPTKSENKTKTRTQLSSIVSMQITSCGILSNLFHLVMYVDTDAALKWNDDELITRFYVCNISSYQNHNQTRRFASADCFGERYALKINSERPSRTDIFLYAIMDVIYRFEVICAKNQYR